MLPLISVLVPSYNHSRYLRATIESVWRQTYRNIELIVVDDASTDGSIELIQELMQISPIPMRVHFNDKNEGVIPTVHKAFSLATGDLVSFFASDDVYAPSAFDDSVKLLLEDPEVQVVFANGLVMKESGEFGNTIHDERVKRLLSCTPQEILKYLYTHSSPFFLQTALIRRSLIADRDPMDKYVLADDWLTNIRIFEKFPKTAFLDKIVFYYRLHGENLHKNLQRHVALKKQMVELYTPKKLQREAKANIYWEIGESLSISRPWLAVIYFLRSQLICVRPSLVKQTVSKILRKVVGN